MVGRIREVLRLQAEAVGLPIGLAAGPDQRAVEEVAGVELDARLGRLDLHDPAARRLEHPGSQAERTNLRLVEHEIVVVAVPEQGLLVVLADARSRWRSGG